MNKEDVCDHALLLTKRWLPDCELEDIDYNQDCGCYSEWTTEPPRLSLTFRAPWTGKAERELALECCGDKDLRKVEGVMTYNRIPAVKFCVYCGARWHYRTFMDAAGSTDWEYRKEESVADDSVKTRKTW